MSSLRAPTRFALRMAGLALTGFDRETNEDAVGCFDDRLAAVVDAMGGNASGSLVPPVLLPVLRESLRHAPDDGALSDHIAGAFLRVYESLVATGRVVGLPMTGAGAVMGALWISGDRAVFAHVGDTRCYRWRDSRVTQIGSEHTLVREMRDRAEFATPAARATLDQYKHIVTRAIFADRPPEPEIVELDLRVGDRFLLCSDGLWRTFDDLAPEAILDPRAPFDEALVDVMRRGLERPSGDNLSGVVAEVIALSPSASVTKTERRSNDAPELSASALRATRWQPAVSRRDEVSACVEGLRDVAAAWEALASRGIIPMSWSDSTRRFLSAPESLQVRSRERDDTLRELIARGDVIRDVSFRLNDAVTILWQRVVALPPTLEALQMVAWDVDGIERAERLIDEAASRLRPFGHASPARHLWTFERERVMRVSARWPLNLSAQVVAAQCDVRESPRDRWPGSFDTPDGGAYDYVARLCEGDDAWSEELTAPVPRWHGTLRAHPYADLASPFRPLREILSLGYQALDVGLWGRILAMLSLATE